MQLPGLDNTTNRSQKQGLHQTNETNEEKKSLLWIYVELSDFASLVMCIVWCVKALRLCGCDISETLLVVYFLYGHECKMDKRNQKEIMKFWGKVLRQECLHTSISSRLMGEGVNGVLHAVCEKGK